MLRIAPARVLAALVLSVMLAGGAAASTVNVIETSGPVDGASSNGPDQDFNGTAITFTLADGLTDAALSLNVLCVLGPCGGLAFLSADDVTQGSPSLAALTEVVAFNTPTDFDGTPIVGFAGLSLAAGTYSLQVTFQSGFGGLLGSVVPDIFANLGATVGGSIIYKANNPALPAFSVSGAAGYTPHFTLSGMPITAEPPSVVPLPAGILLLGSALVLVRLRRR